MKLIDILSIISGWKKITVYREQYIKNENGDGEVKRTNIYEGQLREWDAKVNDIIDETVSFVFVGTDGGVSIELR